MSDSGERIAKVETSVEYLHTDVQKLAEVNNKQFEQNQKLFNEIGQNMVKIQVNLENSVEAISNLKETTKSLIDQVADIDHQNKNIASIQTEIIEIKKKLSVFEEISNKAQGGWKALTFLAATISFLVSTGIGAFVYNTMKPQVLYSQNPVVEHAVEKVIQSQQPTLKGK